ncbi:MAG: hypothetical protein DRN12_01820 [Thermoplasmata archaeon]|mgnify:CR=1 FL=1|nr:MAG: hypothetical protein DRN12_01820 [Thermoplasmata archaeon]
MIGLNLNIVGGKVDIINLNDFMNSIKKFSDKYDIIIQTFDANLIYGRDHILSAVSHAIRSMEERRNRTNSLGMEILLYAAGERQLKNAISKIGVKEGENKDIILLLLDLSNKYNLSKITSEILGTLGIHRDDSVIDGDLETLIRFGIKQEEIDTITKHKYGDLILEKIALVDVMK